MLDTAPRAPIHSSRFPPIPYVDPPPRTMPEAERRIIRAALALTPTLPTDWPDLSPLIDAVDQALGESEAASEGDAA